MPSVLDLSDHRARMGGTHSASPTRAREVEPRVTKRSDIRTSVPSDAWIFAASVRRLPDCCNDATPQPWRSELVTPRWARGQCYVLRSSVGSFVTATAMKPPVTAATTAPARKSAVWTASHSRIARARSGSMSVAESACRHIAAPSARTVLGQREPEAARISTSPHGQANRAGRVESAGRREVQST